MALAVNNFVCFFFLDKDECAENPCPPHSKCKNTLGSFSCECEQGFKDVDNSCIGMFCVRVFFPVTYRLFSSIMTQKDSTKCLLFSLFAPASLSFSYCGHLASFLSLFIVPCLFVLGFTIPFFFSRPCKPCVEIAFSFFPYVLANHLSSVPPYLCSNTSCLCSSSYFVVT